LTLAITAFLFFLFLALPLPRGAIPGAIAIRIALRVTLLGLIASCLAAALRRAAHLTISEAILSSRAQIVHRDLSQSEPVSYPQARVVETMVRSSTRRLRCFGESREKEELSRMQWQQEIENPPRTHFSSITKWRTHLTVSVIEFDLKQIEMHYRTTTEPTSRVLEFFVTFSVANGGFMLILEFILW